MARTLLCVCASMFLFGCPGAQRTTDSSGNPPIITKSAPGAKVYFIGLKDGDTVGQNVTVHFGLKGMGIAPAGIAFDNSGHHHLLIDYKGMPAMDKPLPMGETLKHFGKGQTEVDLKLKPGKHTLQLVFGNQFHIPHDPPVVSEKITITVK